MKTFSPLFVFLASATLALANTAPTVVIQSAQMRPGTTLMDVVYRVNDPDDATVKTRALAFVDGQRSFAKVIRPVTFVEGTAAKLGDAIAANTDHTLTWDVGADWNVSLGQVKFEVLTRDGRGLLPLDWISIPAAGENPALAVSKNSPTFAEVLDGMFWQYADGDPGLTLSGGILTGNSNSGVFNQVMLVYANSPQSYATPYLLKRMNLDPMDPMDAKLASAARANVTNPDAWHAANRPYTGITLIKGWGSNNSNELGIPTGLTGVTAIAAGYNYSLALKNDGTVVAWGSLPANIPTGLTGVTAIAAGNTHCLALKSDGTVVAWGYNYSGQTNIPAGLTGVTSIAAGSEHSLALKSNGTVVAWGNNFSGQLNFPAGLTGVTAIAANDYHSLALKNNGTMVAWGSNSSGQPIPAGLTGVTAIAEGAYHSLALKGDGTVVAWGSNGSGQTNIPAGLTGVTAISAGSNHNLALKSDGTLVAWGKNSNGQTNIPSGLTGVTAIAAGYSHSLALKAKAP